MPQYALYALAAVGALVLFAVARKLLGGPTPMVEEPEGSPLPSPSPAAPPQEESQEASSVLGRLAQGLARTKGRLVSGLDDLFRGKREIDDELWGQLEELLIRSDVGVKTALRLLEEMRSQAEREELSDPLRLRSLPHEHLPGLGDLLRLVVPQAAAPRILDEALGGREADLRRCLHRRGRRG